MTDVWLAIVVTIIAFYIIFPEDSRNILALIGLLPSLIRLWLAERLLMLKLGPRLAVETWLMRRRAAKVRKSHDSVKQTTTKKPTHD